MTHDHQDWNNIVFKKQQTTSNKQQSTVRVDRNNKLHKLENESESFEVQKVSLNLSKQIQQSRLAKKMTQKQLAQQSNISVKIINDYESGKAIPNNIIKMKIQKVLNVTFKK
jgi:ribosome-binding protein aMBF1 (putative translation factor)